MSKRTILIGTLVGCCTLLLPSTSTADFSDPPEIEIDINIDPNDLLQPLPLPSNRPWWASPNMPPGWIEINPFNPNEYYVHPILIDPFWSDPWQNLP